LFLASTTHNHYSVEAGNVARDGDFSMQCTKLTDDDLWSGIAKNTNATSLLFDEHRELDASIEIDPDGRADLMRSHLETVSKLMREYHEYTAELRRRHPLG
jgi:DNA-binding FadR family transcriptional regulator